MPITPNAAVISANNDPALDRVLSRDNQTIVFSDDGAVILNTDRNVQVNLFEQLVQQNYITSVTEVNNPGGNIDGEIQLKAGANFGASANLIFDRNTGILRIPKIATDNLLYSNGAGWDFGTGTGIAYSNTNVEDWLNSGANAPVSIARGIDTGTSNVQANVVQANIIVAANFQYSNGTPLFVPYNDIDVVRLLNTGSNGNSTIANIVATGNISTSNNLISSQALYVRPTFNSNPEGDRSAILPGLPDDPDSIVSNIYNIGSATRLFKNLYANGTIFTTDANLLGNITAQGNISASNLLLTGSLSSNNITVSNSITAANAIVNNNFSAGNIISYANITAANIIANTSLALPNFVSNSVGSLLSNAVVLSPTISTTLTANVSQLRITGGANGQFLRTAGDGNLTWANVVTATIANGNSNVSVSANGNVTISVAGRANIITVTDTGANLSNLSVAGNSYLGNVGAITILGGTANYVLSTDGQGNLSWQQGGTTNFYSGNAAAANSIATNSQINAALPAGTLVRNGDIFMDTNAAAQNQQPVYINVNGQWRQFLTAFGGL